MQDLISLRNDDSKVSKKLLLSFGLLLLDTSAVTAVAVEVLDRIIMTLFNLWDINSKVAFILSECAYLVCIHNGPFATR